MRSRDWMLAFGAMAVVALLLPMQERISAQSPTGIVISEIRFHGAGIDGNNAATAPNDEFIELFNTSTTPQNISGWMIRASNNNSPAALVTRMTIGNVLLQPGCYFLAVNSNGYSGTSSVPGDQAYTVGFGDNGGVALTTAAGVIVDQVGLGTSATAYGEGTRLAPLTTDTNRGYERNSSTTLGYVDTNNNNADFHLQTPSTPNNSASACVTLNVTPPPVIRLPHEIQGAAAVSPLALGTNVNVRGVVTARKADGFFIQTAAGMEDADANTSEGLFVSTTGATLASASVGRLVTVTGAVAELPAGTVGTATVTALASVTSVMDEGPAIVPAPYALSSADLSPAGPLNQLERLEGMRVTASLTSISGTDSDGAFFAVLSNQARPFREPGVEAGHAVLPCAIGPCNIPLFDGNPERLRVDSDALEGVARVDLTSLAAMTNVVGPLDFNTNAYTLLPETTLNPTGGTALFAAPDPAFDQFTVASLNMVRFAELPAAVYQTQLAKASSTIRDVMKTPDILGLQGVESITVLAALASRVDADALAAGQPAPQYEPFLFEGTDPSHLNIGVLAKQRGARVMVDSFDAPISSADFEHPPVVLHATVAGPATSLPQTVTVIVNHFASQLNIDQANVTGDAARAKREAQAEALANFIQGLQINDPHAAILSIGDYNAFSFNDGYADLLGTVGGVPASPDQVAVASTDLVSPDLTNLTDSVPASERYSSITNGNAQALDHMLVSTALVPQFVGLARPRVNADFPESLRGDAGTPIRLGDRDPMVAYFSFPPDLGAPVFAAAQDQVFEATDANGAVVSYVTPTATDNLDAWVSVDCVPASGTLFALGNTGVTCSAQDHAGNQATGSFTVTVQDTIAPALTVPVDFAVEAASAAGSVVSFTTTATDAVTSSLTVDCTPLSGSLFAVGATTVHCSTHDAALNAAQASFVVTVRDTTAPVVTVPSNLTVEAASAAGSVVSFTATATDAVTSSLTVTCTPASGVFPIGTTSVQCSSQDEALNSGSASFTVTVRDTTAPVLTVPSALTVEAASAAGSTVSFATTASDAVTTAPSVTCTPASGSVFPRGTTTVHCSAADAAGNTTSASFDITVRDTVAPVLSLPSHLTEQASSPSGKSVSFVATATDAVTASPAVACTPASGSTFPVGDTLVSCVATDAAGNSSSGTFVVTVTAATTVFGHMAGMGDVVSSDARVDFAFDVRESPLVGERGWVVLQLRDGNGRAQYFSANVTAVQLSNNEGYQPGSFPRSGVDTVVFSGCGKWNGRAGYRYEITASDRGEPGPRHDTFSLKLYSPTGELVENISGTLRDGNVQSLR